MRYPENQMHEEIAFIAYYLHWSYREILQMDHAERRRWCAEISKIHRRLHERETERRDDA